MSGPRPGFASDNNAPADPAVLAALADASRGSVPAYGDDPLTRRVLARLAALFGGEAEAHLVWGGTAANVLGLATVMRPHEAVLCTDVAHINVDECGAPERFLGAKLLTARAPDGKLTPSAVQGLIRGVGVPHHVQPRVVSLTQSTEYGTVYRPEEIRAIAEVAHAHGLLVHMDGARLANAAAFLDCAPRVITADAGVDLLSFGATKNGAIAAEAVVFLREGLSAAFPFVRKQGMQLASKMRFVAAQFEALLDGDRWLANAVHANWLARRLAERVRDLPGVRITQPVEANAVFAILDPAAIETLQREFWFYTWDERAHEVRWMTSFATTEEEVERFAARVREVCG